MLSTGMLLLPDVLTTEHCLQDAVWLKPSRDIACRTSDEVRIFNPFQYRSLLRVGQAAFSLMGCDGAGHMFECHNPASNHLNFKASGFSSQVLLLLQSSDRIAHDICDALPECGGGSAAISDAPELTLVLRQWRALASGREFRCFVAGGELAGDAVRPREDVLGLG